MRAGLQKQIEKLARPRPDPAKHLIACATDEPWTSCLSVVREPWALFFGCRHRCCGRCPLLVPQFETTNLKIHTNHKFINLDSVFVCLFVRSFVCLFVEHVLVHWYSLSCNGCNEPSFHSCSFFSLHECLCVGVERWTWQCNNVLLTVLPPFAWCLDVCFRAKLGCQETWTESGRHIVHCVSSGLLFFQVYCLLDKFGTGCWKYV